MKLCHAILFFLFLTPLNGENWQRVYLATYPRSGNHWSRYLIEEATQIATGSVYLDKVPPHLPHPFPWGGYTSKNGYEGNRRYPGKKDIIVIKTHYPAVLPPSPYDFMPHKMVVRIVRNPLDTFYAQHARDKQPNPPKQIPNEALKQYILDWANFQNYWNEQPNVLTIRYEDLFKNPKHFLKKILKTMGYNVSSIDIERAITKYPPEEDPLKKKQYYSRSDLDEIRTSLKDLLEQFHYEIN